MRCRSGLGLNPAPTIKSVSRLLADRNYHTVFNFSRNAPTLSPCQSAVPFAAIASPILESMLINLTFCKWLASPPRKSR
jgi:hypothetical protein